LWLNSYGFQLEEELVRILKLEKNIQCSGVEMLINAWITQQEKITQFMKQEFSLTKDEITGMQTKF